MRFLFTIQGEGRGHYTQALSLSAMLRRHGHEVVAVLVGTSDVRQIPSFFSKKINAPIEKFRSPNFTSFYKNKKPRILMSVLNNSVHTFIFRKSIGIVKNAIEEHKPDMVINFYEMITGLSYGLYRFDKKMNIPMVCIAHQYILLNSKYKTTPEQDIKYYWLRMLSKVTSNRASKILALSFRNMPGDDKVVIVPPLLRSEVFKIEPTDGNYIHGYMLNSGYFEEINKWHKKNPHIPLRFFWDNKEAEEETLVDDNFILYKLDDEKFLRNMAGCMAYATTSGFESVCEALYYRKPTLMIPVHVEQAFNAYDAQLSGVGIIGNKFKFNKLLEFKEKSYNPDENFKSWVLEAEDRILKEITSVYKPTESR
ncbi:MAG: glycosyltransferase family protein [Fermentimonas sp.]|jgi:uncharacterized protein (TIGR00661 family)